MKTPTIFFEDFSVGDEMTLGPVTVGAEDIVDFARQWDPQAMHTDPDAAATTAMGGLVASGWHTCCVLMRMMCDDFLLDAASRGAPAVEEVRWLKPVRPGDTLTARRTVLETRGSRSRPDMGVVRSRYEISNQDGDTVMTIVFPGFFGRRAGVEPTA